jgi:hypothetical protein
MPAFHPWSSRDLSSKRFLFLGCPLKVWSDSEIVLNEFGKIYERFQAAEEYTDGSRENLQPFSIYIITATSDHRPVLWAGGESILLEEGEIPARIYFFILNYLFREVGSFFILHGGVVEKDGKGIIISGPSAAGKTTLIVELVKRGYAFLSDELAPIHRETGLIEPFPRRIGIRKNQGEFKELLDVGELPGGRLGKTCPPGWIFFLSPVLKEGQEKENRTIEIAFNKVDQDLLEALSRMGEVLSIEPLGRRPFPTLRLEILHGPFVQKLDQLCKNLGVFINQSYNGFSESPDFSASPQIETLSGMAGVLEATKHLLNGRPPSRLCRELNNSQTALVMELAGLLAGAPIYRLSPGRLEELIEKIEDKIQ